MHVKLCNCVHVYNFTKWFPFFPIPILLFPCWKNPGVINSELLLTSRYCFFQASPGTIPVLVQNLCFQREPTLLCSQTSSWLATLCERERACSGWIVPGRNPACAHDFCTSDSFSYGASNMTLQEQSKVMLSCLLPMEIAACSAALPESEHTGTCSSHVATQHRLCKWKETFWIFLSLEKVFQWGRSDQQLPLGRWISLPMDPQPLRTSSPAISWCPCQVTDGSVPPILKLATLLSNQISSALLCKLMWKVISVNLQENAGAKMDWK